MKRLLLLLLVAAGPAPAPNERPLLAPQREVSVLYSLMASDTAPTEIRISTKNRGAIRRIDLPDRNYMLIYSAQQAMIMVTPPAGTVAELPWNPGLAEQFTLTGQMRFAKRATATVAGLRCTVWDVLLGATRGQVCVTDEGVMLRTLTEDPRGRRTAVEAVSVTFTPAPEADYLPPPDFERVQPAAR